MLMASQSNCTVHSTAVCTVLAVHVFTIGLHCLECVLPPRTFTRNNPIPRGHCTVSMDNLCVFYRRPHGSRSVHGSHKQVGYCTAMSFLYCCLWPDAHGQEAGTYCPLDPRAELSGCCMRSLPEQSIWLYSWIACKYLCHFNVSYVFAVTV